MMLLKLENPVLFSKAIELISDLVTEVRIKVNEFGMNLVAIDPANVAMVGLKIPKTSFTQFETGEEVLGVNLEDFKKILKRAGIKSTLILEKQENLLKIKIEDRIKREFSLNLIEVEGEEKEIPSLEFSSKVEIGSSDLINSIEDCAIVADACSFVIQDGKFIIEAKSMNAARSEFSGDEATIEAENCKSRYSIEYLQKFIKGSKLSEKTKFQFANDHPLRMDINAENINLTFILAPRVETDD
jgi:proliferating cell nuclear antigen